MSAEPCSRTQHQVICDASLSRAFGPKGSMAPDGTGGAFVVWQDGRGGSGTDIYIHHILPSGAPDLGWGFNGLPLTNLASSKVLPRVAIDGAGGAIVVWMDNRNGDYDIYAHHVLNSGVLDPDWPASGLPVCTAVNDQELPVMTPDGSGGVIVAWQDKRNLRYDLFAHHILAGGILDPAWTGNGVAVAPNTEDQYNPSIVSDDAGGAIIEWEDWRDAGTTYVDIYALRLQPNGTVAPGWPAGGRALCTATGHQGLSELVSDGAGGAIGAWRDLRGADADVYAQHVQGSGTVDPLWPLNGRALCTATGDQDWIDITTDDVGGAIVIWRDARSGASSEDVYAQHVFADGTIGAGWPADGLAVCGAPDRQLPGVVQPDGAGGAIVVWNDRRSGSAVAVYAQHVSGAGLIDPLWPPGGKVVYDDPVEGVDAISAAALSDEGGGVFAVWKTAAIGFTEKVMSQRVRFNGTVDDYLEDNDVCAVARDVNQGAFPNLAAAAGDPDWYWMTLPQATQLQVTLSFTHADGDIDLALWDGCGGSLLAQSAGTSDGEMITYLNTGPDMQVFINVYLYAGECNTYYMDIGLDAANNLNATITPPGWFAPIVPRDLADATPGNVPITPSLPGNTPGTYFNWAGYNLGTQALPAWDTDLWLDDALVASGTVAAGNLPDVYMVGNNGPHTVRGGRHTLVHFMDPGMTVYETNEGDNAWSGQWVWSPLVGTFESPVVRQAPPFRGGFPFPNSDGMSYTRASGYAWVVSAAGRNPGDDYDLYVFDDYSGSTVGFSNELNSSLRGGNKTDVVAGHYSGTPLTVYPASVLYAAGGGGGDYAADFSDARLRNHNLATSGTTWENQTLPPNRLADVYEAYMEAGMLHTFTLIRTAGVSDLAFAIMPAAPGLVLPVDAMTPSSPASPTVDALSFTPAVTGWHPIVVYRDEGTGSNTEAIYRFLWRQGLVGVPDDAPTALAFRGVLPNPIVGRGRFEFALPAAAAVELAVFDVEGHRVWRRAGRFEAGTQTIAWNARDAAGHLLPPGVYWARLDAAGTMRTRRVVVMR